MRNSIKDVRFFSGGRALFTVAGPQRHYTYRIVKHPEKHLFFAQLLTGPENGSNFTYLGIYNHLNFSVVLTSKSSFQNHSDPVKGIRWAIYKVYHHEELPEGWSIQHHGRCSKCYRVLTDPTSIETGMGPKCRSFAYAPTLAGYL